MRPLHAIITFLGGRNAVDPGYGVEGPVDPGYGVEGPVDPGYGLPHPGHPGHHPSHPIAPPPPVVGHPIEPGGPVLKEGDILILVYAPGHGYKWVIIDEDLSPEHPIVVPPAPPAKPSHPIQPVPPGPTPH